MIHFGQPPVRSPARSGLGRVVWGPPGCTGCVDLAGLVWTRWGGSASSASSSGLDGTLGLLLVRWAWPRAPQRSSGFHGAGAGSVNSFGFGGAPQTFRTPPRGSSELSGLHGALPNSAARERESGVSPRSGRAGCINTRLSCSPPWPCTGSLASLPLPLIAPLLLAAHELRAASVMTAQLPDTPLALAPPPGRASTAWRP